MLTETLKYFNLEFFDILKMNSVKKIQYIVEFNCFFLIF